MELRKFPLIENQFPSKETEAKYAKNYLDLITLKHPAQGKTSYQKDPFIFFLRHWQDKETDQRNRSTAQKYLDFKPEFPVFCYLYSQLD